MEAQEVSEKDSNSIAVQSKDQPQPATLDPGDGNFISRKLWFSIGTSVLIFIGGILAGVWKLFDTHYESMISGLLGVLGLYLGSNVSSKYITGKHLASIANADPSDQ